VGNASNLPRSESVEAFIPALKLHDRVASVTRRGSRFILDVVLTDGRKMVVYMTNIYCVGEADVVDILDVEPDVTAIVTLSMWNQTSADAAIYGRQQQVGVFTWSNFFGALNYRKFWLYEPMPYDIKEDKKKQESRRRRAAWN
jgi:hypothetical protein